MKKVISLLAICTLGIALTACGAFIYDDGYYGGPVGVGVGAGVWGY
jgi:hypothetical protein